MFLLIASFACSFNNFARAQEPSDWLKKQADESAKEVDEALGKGAYGGTEHVAKMREETKKEVEQQNSTTKSDEYDEGFSDGYRQGHEEGWLSGYGEGKIEGYSEGYDARYDEEYESEETSESNNANSNSLPYFICGIVVLALIVFAIFKWS